MRTHFRITALASLMIAACAGPLVFAAEDYMPPKTDFGVPDVQGVWNYKTRTGLERADVYEGVLEVDEATMLEKMVSTPDFIAFLEATGAEAPGPENVGGYNGFWITPGDALAIMNGKYRSSLIVDPPDGKIPWRGAGSSSISTGRVAHGHGRKRWARGKNSLRSLSGELRLNCAVYE